MQEIKLKPEAERLIAQICVEAILRAQQKETHEPQKEEVSIHKIEC